MPACGCGGLLGRIGNGNRIGHVRKHAEIVAGITEDDDFVQADAQRLDQTVDARRLVPALRHDIDVAKLGEVEVKARYVTVQHGDEVACRALVRTATVGTHEHIRLRCRETRQAHGSTIPVTAAGIGIRRKDGLKVLEPALHQDGRRAIKGNQARSAYVPDASGHDSKRLLVEVGLAQLPPVEKDLVAVGGDAGLATTLVPTEEGGHPGMPTSAGRSNMNARIPCGVKRRHRTG